MEIVLNQKVIFYWQLQRVIFLTSGHFRGPGEELANSHVTC